jgi:hypothetical protein
VVVASLTRGGRMRTAHQGALEVRWRFASWVRSELADGGLDRVRGARQRVVLALLVLHANQVVASGRVLLELWRGRPGRERPMRCRRPSRGCAGAPRLPDEIDLGRFE